MMDREIPTFLFWDGHQEFTAILALREGTLSYVVDELTVGDLIMSKSALLNDFHLAEPFPNPFNSSTSMEYYLPVSTRISISIINNSGENIMLLENGFKSAGVHLAEIDGGLLPSGTYFVRLTADSEVRTQKITLLR